MEPTYSLLDESFDDCDSWLEFDPASLDFVGSELTSRNQRRAASAVIDVDNEDESRDTMPVTLYPQADSRGRLSFVPLAVWNTNDAYDEQPSIVIRYTIEWKLTVNSRVVTKDTEQNIVLAPTDFWNMTLKKKLENRMKKKLSHKKSYKADDTNIVVVVTDRSECDLTKCCDGLDIEWGLVEKQLRSWSPLFRAGKKLRVELSFNYLETGQGAGTSGQRGCKRGFSSVSQQMIAERALQLDAEEDATDQPAIWREVYRLMRCPVPPPCGLGPYCWRDDSSKKHYKLKTHYFRQLIRYVEQGNNLLTHNDVPKEVQEQLFAEEQQSIKRRKRNAVAYTSPDSYPPINITNVLPAQSPAQSIAFSTAPTPTGMWCVVQEEHVALVITGPRKIAEKRYCDWQCSQVDDEVLKMEVRKARNLTLREGLDL